MADNDIHAPNGFVGQHFTAGGTVNVPACIQGERTSYSLPKTGTKTLTVAYTVADPALVNLYLPAVYGTPYPTNNAYTLCDVQVSFDQGGLESGCATITEKYEKTAPEPGELPPDPVYTLRTSEIDQPVTQNCHFWEVRPPTPAPITYISGPNAGKPGYICLSGGKIRPQFAGYIAGSTQQANTVEGALAPFSTFGVENDEHSFPLCHPKHGIESFSSSGAEWTCTTYNVGEPTQGDIGDTHIIQNPAGLVGATLGKWKYVDFSWESRDWQEFTRVWRYNPNYWDPHLYWPCDDPNGLPAVDYWYP